MKTMMQIQMNITLVMKWQHEEKDNNKSDWVREAVANFEIPQNMISIVFKNLHVYIYIYIYIYI